MIEIDVRGAANDDAARQVALTIAGSPLVKTMFAGADPNWGRILAAAGRAGVKFDPAASAYHLADVLTCRRGIEHPFSETRVHNRMLRDFVPVVVDLGSGRGRAVCGRAISQPTTCTSTPPIAPNFPPLACRRCPRVAKLILY